VQNIADPRALSQLLICLGDAMSHEQTVRVPGGLEVSRVLPLAVYLTGLPDFAHMAGAAKGATFARRFATTTLGPISDEELRLALHPFVSGGWVVPVAEGGTAPVAMTPDAADEIVRLCRGEPFLFQLAGERAWYAGAGSTITREEVRAGWTSARSEAVAHVERILERLPGRERQLLEVMAQLEPVDRTLTTIAKVMGFEGAAQAGPTAQRLDTVRGVIERGRPYRFRHRAVEAYLTSDWPDVSST
jgi:hypothetical protein